MKKKQKAFAGCGGTHRTEEQRKKEKRKLNSTKKRKPKETMTPGKKLKKIKNHLNTLFHISHFFCCTLRMHTVATVVQQLYLHISHISRDISSFVKKVRACIFSVPIQCETCVCCLLPLFLFSLFCCSHSLLLLAQLLLLFKSLFFLHVLLSSSTTVSSTTLVEEG